MSFLGGIRVAAIISILFQKLFAKSKAEVAR